MIDRYFEEVMIEIIGDDSKGIRHLQEAISQKDEKISVRSLQRYIKGDNVPSFEVAKLILSVSNVNYSDEELKEILKQSKELCKSRKAEQRVFKVKLDKHIVIDANALSIGDMSGEYVLDYMDNRINELYGEDNNTKFSLYIRDLIIEDIKKGILGNEH